MKKILLTALLASTAFTNNAIADDNAKTADDHAPIGVMGEHTHKKGHMMLSYRYGDMGMAGNRVGTNDVTTADVHANFMIAPLDMDMKMHMFGAMYGVTDKLTMMAMVPVTEKSMNLQTRMGMNFATKSQGLGDIKINGIYQLKKYHPEEQGARNAAYLLLNFGVSLPTGDIEERDDTPMGADMKLPYPMQIGSGTTDPMLGLTYIRKRDGWTWGIQGKNTFRFGDNDQGYRLGNEFAATGWVSKSMSYEVSLSLRWEGKSWGDIKGMDPMLNPMMVPTARTDLRGGKRIDVFAGVNLMATKGSLKGHRLAIEYGVPAYQKLDGPQLETDHRLIVGWQYAF